MIESPMVVLPQPDSPTMPTHSPSSTSNEIPSTATTVECRRRNSVREVVDLENGAHLHPVQRYRPLAATAPATSR